MDAIPWTERLRRRFRRADTQSNFPLQKMSFGKRRFPSGSPLPYSPPAESISPRANANKLLTICLDAKTGHQLWLARNPSQESHQAIFRANDPASPTPVADENGVVASSPISASPPTRPTGKDRWTVPLGPFKNFYGMAASPILAGDLLMHGLRSTEPDPSFWPWTAKPAASAGKQIVRRFRIGWATPMVFRARQWTRRNSSSSAPPGSTPTTWTPANPYGGCRSLREARSALPWPPAEALCLSRP